MPQIDSAWGYQTLTLADPAAPRGDSDWGSVTTTLLDPAPVQVGRDSSWGAVTVTLSTPHYPIAVKTSTGVNYVPIL